MEWSFKPLAKRCAATDEPFTDGAEVVSLVIKSVSGDLMRYDVLSENIEKFTTQGTLLGQWKRFFSINSNSTIAAKQRIANQEEFFLSLFDAPATEEGDLLKQLFALLLERKRILRPVGTPKDNEQQYVHIRSKQNFIVPVKPFGPKDIAGIEEFLNI